MVSSNSGWNKSLRCQPRRTIFCVPAKGKGVDLLQPNSPGRRPWPEHLWRNTQRSQPPALPSCVRMHRLELKQERAPTSQQHHHPTIPSCGCIAFVTERKIWGGQLFVLVVNHNFGKSTLVPHLIPIGSISVTLRRSGTRCELGGWSPQSASNYFNPRPAQKLLLVGGRANSDYTEIPDSMILSEGPADELTLS